MAFKIHAVNSQLGGDCLGRFPEAAQTFSAIFRRIFVFKKNEPKEVKKAAWRGLKYQEFENSFLHFLWKRLNQMYVCTRRRL